MLLIFLYVDCALQWLLVYGPIYHQQQYSLFPFMSIAYSKTRAKAIVIIQWLENIAFRCKQINGAEK